MSLETLMLQLVVWLPMLGAILIGIIGGGSIGAPRRIAAIITDRDTRIVHLALRGF